MKIIQKTENLSQTSKQILSNHIVRKSVRQKTNFINFIKDELKDANLEFNVEKYDYKNKNRNIIIGDYKNAKYIFTAHYDTCATLGFLPNFICPKNTFLFLLIQTLIGVILVAPAIIASLIIQYFLKHYGEMIAFFGYEICLFSMLFFIIYLMFNGFPNKNNYNDNTSGVITLIEMIKKVPFHLKKDFCFIFFDNEEKGLLGSKAFYKKHLLDKIENKTFINFDCVSEGNHLLFIHKNINNNLLNYLQNYQTNTNKFTYTYPSKKAIFPSDHRKFPSNIGVGAFNKKKFIGFYLGRIHTYRDVCFDEDNIFTLVDIFLNIPTGNL